MPRTSRIASLLAAALAVAAACTGPAPDEPARVKVAFFQDLSVPDDLDLVSPAFLAMETAVSQATDLPMTVELVQLDTDGDPTRALELAREVAGDPAYVAAVAAPLWVESPEVADVLADAGVPTLSLSAVTPYPWTSGDRTGASPTAPTAPPTNLWRRFVVDQGAQAARLAGIALKMWRGRGSGPFNACIAGDGSAISDDLGSSVDSNLPVRVPRSVVASHDPSSAASEIGERECAVVVWTGFGEGAAELVSLLGGTDTPRLVVADTVKTAAYLEQAGEAGRGTVATCQCVDVTTRADAHARGFVHAYQAETGLAPGVYAAEAWDVAQVLIDAIRGGASDRAGVRDVVGGLRRLDGLAGRYLFDSGGERRGSGLVRPFLASGTRWIPVHG